jgi:hypothetical protein
VERCLDFLDGLRRRIEQMLGHIIDFIHECVAYQSLIGSLSYRDRLCRKHQDVLIHAVSVDVCMPLVDNHALPDITMQWSNQAQKKPVQLNLDQLKALEEYVPAEVKSRQVPWKESFLRLARQQWHEDNGQGLMLGSWLKGLLDDLRLDPAESLQGLWLLIQDMPEWSPQVLVVKAELEAWQDMGTFYLEPVLLNKEEVSEQHA